MRTKRSKGQRRRIAAASASREVLRIARGILDLSRPLLTAAGIVAVAGCSTGLDSLGLDGTRTGSVNVSETVVSATFTDSSAVPKLCRVLHGGNCVLHVCTPDASDGGTHVPIPRSAGAVTIEGSAPPLLRLAQKVDKTYTSLSTQSIQYYNPGDMLAIAASGGDTPSFAGQVAAPRKTILDNPPLSPDLPLPLDTHADLLVLWTGGDVGSWVVVNINGAEGSATADITCEFPAEDHAGLVPLMLLYQLQAGNYAVSTKTINRTSFYADVWQIALTASAGARVGTATVR